MLALVLLAALPIGHAATPDRSNIAKPFKGLTTVYASYGIHDPQHDLKVSEDEFAQQAYQSLQRSGLTIAGPDERDKYNASHKDQMPYVYIDVEVTGPDSNGVKSFTVDISLTEWVSLARTRDIKFEATVWDYSPAAQPIDAKVSDELRTQTDKCFQRLIDDYKLVNPKN
jgi:poly(A) polymerase Pap1